MSSLFIGKKCKHQGEVGGFKDKDNFRVSRDSLNENDSLLSDAVEERERNLWKMIVLWIKQ